MFTEKIKNDNFFYVSEKMNSIEALENEARRCKSDNKTLRISSTNVDGLDEEKRDELLSLIEDGIDVICLQETKRRRDDLRGELKYEGYKSITVEREGNDKQGNDRGMYIYIFFIFVFSFSFLFFSFCITISTILYVTLIFFYSFFFGYKYSHFKSWVKDTVFFYMTK